MVSRLVDQKGFDLLAALADQISRQLDATFVLLGTGEAALRGACGRGWPCAHPDRIAVRIGFDERLAHLIEGGADIFLMPSRFEPCGLNQMYSLRYGTVPVVRATGGLDDTIVNWNPRTGRGTGFKFRGRDARSAAGPRSGRRLRALRAAGRRGGRCSWRGWRGTIPGTRRPGEYVKVYEKAIKRPVRP